MRIGKIDIPQAVVLAPMEDVTDIPFRMMCKHFGADIVYTEFVNSEGLVRKSAKTRKKMEFLPEERPFGIQLYGGDEHSLEGAARIAAELEPDLIDINCGCWVKNVVGHGAGAGLLRDLPKFEKIVKTVVNAVAMPVTVKTRLGWDAASIRIEEVARMVEQAGAQALTVHCRTRVQGHDGDPDYSRIPAVKEAAAIPIIVNGGITSPERAKAVFNATGCDGVMVARAAIRNPWIFTEIKHYLATGELLPSPPLKERVAVLTDHLRSSVAFKGEKYGVLEFRKHYSGYLRNAPGISHLRMELMQETELNPIIDRLHRYLETISDQPEFLESEAVTL